jgi:hypothetical protein
MGWDINYAGVLDNRRAAASLEYGPRFDMKAAVADYAEKLRGSAR